MVSRPFRVLAVSNDRELLRTISRFLDVFGFETEAVADLSSAQVSLAGQRPDYLIIDSEFEPDALEVSRFALGLQSQLPLYTCLLVSDYSQQLITAAVEAGVDDFLTKPIVCGELLARLRVGARVLQFEDRIRRQASFNPTTNLLSSAALVDRLHEELVHVGRSKSQCSLLAIGVDRIQHIRQTHGNEAGDALLRDVATQISDFMPNDGALGVDDDGTFFALLPGQTQIQAQHWAEDLQRELATCRVESLKEQIPHIATSHAVCSINKGSSREVPPQSFFTKAIEALNIARKLGGNVVTLSGQFDLEQRRWNEIATSGQLFSTTVARDVMAPCPIALSGSQKMVDAIRLLSQSNLAEVPVVDDNGRFLGLLFAEILELNDLDPDALVEDHMVNGIRQFAENTSFDELMELFATENIQIVAITRGQNPIGTIHCNQLAALSEPLTYDSFATETAPSLNSEFLLVADG